MKVCDWDYCRTAVPIGMRRCPDHRDMEWWEEYTEHVKRLCWKDEQIPVDDFEDALDIIHACRDSGGPASARRLLEMSYGIDPKELSG